MYITLSFAVQMSALEQYTPQQTTLRHNLINSTLHMVNLSAESYKYKVVHICMYVYMSVYCEWCVIVIIICKYCITELDYILHIIIFSWTLFFGNISNM